MVQTLQLKRGTTAEVQAITPAVGEPVYDMTVPSLSVGNGVTVGGSTLTVPRIASYAALRAYTGTAPIVEVVGTGIAGTFYRAGGVDDGGVQVGNYRRKFDGPVYINWFGAVGDGVTDCSAALQAAVDYAVGLGGGVVAIPRGTFRKADTTPSIKIGSRVTLMGFGESSVIFHDDQPSNLVRQDVLDLSLSADSTLRDFKITGTVKTFPTETGQKNTIVGTNVRNVRIENVTLDSLRFMAINMHYVRGGVVSGCTLRDVMRDGVRMTQAQDVRVVHNDFERIADDAVALHMLDASGVPTGSGTVVANNTFEFCQGIKILGAKVLSVHDNTFRRSIRLPIVIASDYELEGNTPMFSIDVHNNHIIDSFYNYRTTQSTCAMKFSFRAMSNGGLSTRPGVNSSVLPYNWVNDNDAPGAVNSGSWGLSVKDNTISTSQNATGQLLSSLGYGNVLDRKGGSPDEGYFDPVLTTDFFSVNGIEIFGPIRSISVEGNTFSGGGIGKSAIIIDSNDSTAVMEDLRVCGNTMTDWPGIGLNLTRTSLQCRYVQVRNNNFNLDPLFRHPDHTAANKWTVATNCVAIVGGGSGLSGFVDGNSFAHCGSIVDVVTRFSWGRSNTVLWTTPPSGTGLNGNPNNLGVHTIPSSVKFVHIIYDGDPTSLTFKNVTTTPRMAATAMPTSGTYVAGHFVDNTSFVVSATTPPYVVLGWGRMVTGSAHVLDTDWREFRVIVGT